MTVSPPAAARWKLPFFGLWSGQAASLLGSAIVQFALIWWLTSTTHSATVLATATLAGLLPGVVLGPLSGVVVDRLNRRRVMMVTDSLVALATLGLIVLFATGWVQVWHIYVVLFLRATAGTFQFPAMQASTSLMVPEEQLSRIGGLNQMLQGALSIIAPPAGALLLQLLPMQGVLAVDIVTAVMAVAPLAFIHIPQPARRDRAAGQAAPGFWSDMRSGIRYVLSWPGLLIILGMSMGINALVNPAFSLLPLLVNGHFNGGAFQLAAVESALGIGMVAGGLTLGVWGGFRRRMLTVLAGLSCAGLSIALMGVLPGSAFSAAVGVVFVTGFMLAMTNGPVFAVLQANVAPEMQGRVFALIGSLSAAMAPLGLLVAGPVADALGIGFWYVTAGSAMLLTGLLSYFIPAVVHLEDRPAGSGAALAEPEPVPVVVDY